MRINRLFTLLILLVLAFGSLGAAPFARSAWRTRAWQAKVDAQVLDTSAQGQTEFIVFLAEQADLSGAAQLKTRLEKGRYVFERLSETARRSQAALVSSLEARGAEYRPFWVANMIWVSGDLRLVQALAQRGDVAHLYANPAVRFDPPENPPLFGPEIQSPEAVEWNLAQVGAPQVWAAGFSGQGVVIGGQDTGYDWDHPALKNQYRGWDGSQAQHDYNWHDAIHENNPNTAPGNPCGFDSAQPCDDNSHGTHTMGSMIGDDGAGNQVGMAPGARWIGCRNMEQGVGTPATYSECYQWFIAPTDSNDENPRPELAPDVINNSWSCPPSEGCTDPQVLQVVVENVRAAGILTVHSAGNAGPSCGSVDAPAAIYDASFTVGNTTITDSINPSSSRGPVTADGSSRLKPDISAPGTNIRSSIPGGGYGYKTGTSMSGPHVAGLVALLLSARPELAGQVDEIEEIIRQTARPLTAGQDCGNITGGSVPNNTFGWGRIEAWKAVASLIVELTPNITQPSEPGSAITYTHMLTSAAKFTDTYLLSVSSTAGWGTLAGPAAVSLDPGESTTITVTVSIPADAPAGSLDVTTLTATSQSHPEVSVSVQDQTFVPSHVLYFPIGLSSSGL